MNKRELMKKTSGLEEVIHKYGTVIYDSDEQGLASALRAWLKDIVDDCMRENDSSTHIIVKDLFEKLGMKEGV